MATFQVDQHYEAMHLLSADRYDLEQDLFYMLYENDADRTREIVEFLDENDIRYRFAVDHICYPPTRERCVRLLLVIENEDDAIFTRLRFGFRMWRPIHDTTRFPHCYRIGNIDGDLATI